MAVFDNPIGSILANYYDAIEGGNTYRGAGDSYKGIPGRYSRDPGLLSGDDTPLTASAGGAATTFTVAGTYSWEVNRWVRTDTPGFFAVCTSATNAANVGAARRITNYNDTTKVFTVDAFPAATTAADEFAIREGFRRIPNNIDINAEDTEIPGGFDRMYSLVALTGERMPWYGDGYQTHMTELQLRLRFLKHARALDAIASAFENLAIIRAVITRGEHRGDYVRALIAAKGSSPKVEEEDKDKIIVLDSYDLIYAFDATYL